MKKRVAVGMSGGVDSSVAAYLLKEAGYDVIGVTMKVWKKSDIYGQKEEKDAGYIASSLGIPHYIVDFQKEFQQHVVEYFVREYTAGRTPNPCIACNRYVKWEALLHKALELGVDCIATGHYARIEKLCNGRYAVRNSAAPKKDQTYMLYRLTQQQLSHTLMPLGEYTKEDVRQIAQNAGLFVADKPDSQEICFVEDDDYAKFIREYSGVEFPAGNFVDRKGNVMGRHKGIIHYTVGQRRGLGLSLAESAYVLEIRPKENEVVLGYGSEIFAKEAVAENINFMSRDTIEDGMQVIAKIRYNHSGAPAKIYQEGDRLRCIFEEEQRAVTPGQALVLYDGEYVLGGGTIL